MRKKRLVSLSFIISILIHIVFGGVMWVAPKIFPSFANKKKTTTEIEFVDSSKLLEDLKKQKPEPLGQIVEQDEHQVNDEKPVDSKYLSRHDQTVVHETQAANHGKFKNTDSTDGARQQQKAAGQKVKPQPDAALAEPLDSVPEDQIAKDNQPNQAVEAPAEEMQDDNSAIAVHRKPSLKDLIPSFTPRPPKAEVEAQDVAQGGGSGASATDDHLKNVPTGMQTMLSTREFVYYSYYNRIKEKLRQYWEPKIKEKMEHIMREGRAIASTTDHITRVVIILDNKGTLMRIQVLGPSGMRDLDDAAVEAFRAAAPFPNPPKGIIESDGTVKIRWDFVLEA